MPSQTLPQQAPTVTLSQGLAALFEVTEQRIRDGVRSADTLAMQHAHGRWIARELGAETPLEQIDELVLERLTAPRPRTFGAETMRKRLGTLRAVLKLAHRRRWIPRVPVFPVVLSRSRPRGRFLRSVGEARALYASLPPHRALWFWLALWTGQHASDVERMTWEDVDLSPERPSMLLRNTKNRKVEGLRVRMPGPLADVLRAEHTRARPRRTDKLVRPWPSRKHTLPRHCRKLGLPELNAIDLRHTCLTWIVRRTGITPAACAWAGHSSPQMMAKTYAHALPAQLGEICDLLDAFAKEGGGEQT